MSESAEEIASRLAAALRAVSELDFTFGRSPASAYAQVSKPTAADATVRLERLAQDDTVDASLDYLSPREEIYSLLYEIPTTVDFDGRWDLIKAAYNLGRQAGVLSCQDEFDKHDELLRLLDRVDEQRGRNRTAQQQAYQAKNGRRNRLLLRRWQQLVNRGTKLTVADEQVLEEYGKKYGKDLSMTQWRRIRIKTKRDLP